MLTYKGYRWDNMSGSEQLKVASAIVRKLNPKCGFVLLDKLEQMDTEYAVCGKNVIIKKILRRDQNAKSKDHKPYAEVWAAFVGAAFVCRLFLLLPQPYSDGVPRYQSGERSS